MLSRKLIEFGKLFTLLLLFSFSVNGATVITTAESHKRTVTLDKAGHSFHKNMLQPQVVHVNSIPEQSVKPIPAVSNAFFYNGSILLPLYPTRQAKLFIQDADRCESVSRLLFPFHSFW